MWPTEQFEFETPGVEEYASYVNKLRQTLVWKPEYDVKL